MKKRPYIMVVDDDREMLEMLKRTLKLEGYDVTTAVDGSSALALIGENRLDLVILDIMMSELNGFQVRELIRQHCSVPVITLTARCKANPLPKKRVAGADDYVRMPFHTSELVAHVEFKLRRAGSPATEAISASPTDWEGEYASLPQLA